MASPNTVTFVDASSDLEASGERSAAVVGREVEPRSAAAVHRIVPGDHVQLDDGSPGTVGNLHMGTDTVVPWVRGGEIPAGRTSE